MTISIGREHSVREITVEVRDTAQAEAIAELMDGSTASACSGTRTARMLRHEGGKLPIDAIHPVRTVQEMRDVYTPGVARVCRAIVRTPRWPGATR